MMQVRSYAVRTIEQLVRKTYIPDSQFADVKKRESDYEVPSVRIEDAPEFRWRGLMIDEARHFLGKEAVLRQIDLMAVHKLNVFHDFRARMVRHRERPPVCTYLFSLGGKVYVDERLVFLLRESLDKMGFTDTSCTLHKKCGLSGKVLFPDENLAISLALKLYCRIIHRCTYILAYIAPNSHPPCQCSCHEITIVYYNNLS